MITKFPKALTISCFTTLSLHILWNVVSNRYSSQPIQYPELIRFAFLLRYRCMPSPPAFGFCLCCTICIFFEWFPVRHSKSAFSCS